LWLVAGDVSKVGVAPGCRCCTSFLHVRRLKIRVVEAMHVISSDGWRVMDIVNLACFLITFVMRCAHGRAEERRPSSCRVVGAIVVRVLRFAYARPTRRHGIESGRWAGRRIKLSVLKAERGDDILQMNRTGVYWQRWDGGCGGWLAGLTGCLHRCLFIC
jgi:hypothetical protein